MNDLLLRSRAIYDEAYTLGRPYATVLMVSGGDDSLTAAHAALVLGLPITHILHGVTGTGIPDTTEFVRRIAPLLAPRYLEADAGRNYEEYVLRKGFFGRGDNAHSLAYHTLKSNPFRAAVSKNIRRNHHKFRVLLINGARTDESGRRSRNIPEPIRRDGNTQNYWVNLIHHWTKRECLDFLADQGVERNPVTLLMHRSGECLCGTMQSQGTREEAAFWFPRWGQWLEDLERRVRERGHTHGWGENTGRKCRAIKGEQPLCHDCQLPAASD